MEAPLFDPHGALGDDDGVLDALSLASVQPWPLAMVEVTPLTIISRSGGVSAAGPLSAPTVKMQLLRTSVDSELGGPPGSGRVRLALDDRFGSDDGDGSDDDGDGSDDDKEDAKDEKDDADDGLGVASQTEGDNGSCAESGAGNNETTFPYCAYSSRPARRTVLGGSLFLDRGSSSLPEEETADAIAGEPVDNDDVRAQAPVMFLRSDNPADLSEGVPCRVRGYAPVVVPVSPPLDGGQPNERNGRRQRRRRQRIPATTLAVDAAVTNGTLIRILPAAKASWVEDNFSLEGPTKGQATPRARIELEEPSLLTCMSGELPLSSPSSSSSSSNPSSLDDEAAVLSAHDPEAIRSLSLRMSALLSRPVRIGTTADAVKAQDDRVRRRRRRREAIGRFLAAERANGGKEGSKGDEGGDDKKEEAGQEETVSARTTGPDEAGGGGGGGATPRTNPSPSLAFSPAAIGGGGLVVHSSHSGHGKTLLVAAVARNLLEKFSNGGGDGGGNGGKPNVHVIHAPALFAQYGAGGADAALECLLHGIAMSAAVRQPPPFPPPSTNSAKDKEGGERAEASNGNGIGSVCVILDGLDAFVPPGLSGGSRSAGDPALPALNSIAAYLSRLAKSLSEPLGEFPFPTRNPLYNLTSGDGSFGFVLPVRVALVGVVTCDDDGGRKQRSLASSSGGGFSSTTVLDALGGSRFRLPSPSASTRLSALRRAFEEEGGGDVELDDDAERMLPSLAAGAVELRGDAFGRAARHLKRRSRGKTRRKAGVGDVKAALAAALGDDGASSSATAAAAEVTFSPAKEAGIDGKDDADDPFSSVGGNARAKRALRDALALDERMRLALAAMGRSPPTGVLLYGPPGTGKTLLARAAAEALRKENVHGAGTPAGGGGGGGLGLGGAFVSLRADDVVRAEVGNSEKAVAEAFEVARRNAPSVVFIDEFQALFTERGKKGGSGRLASTLLQCMDDVARWRDADAKAAAAVASEKNGNDGGGGGGERRSSGRVVVLGATNAPWMVDRAFLRPGRFDRTVHVGLPDLGEREAILAVHVGRMRLRAPDADDDVAREGEQEREGLEEGGGEVLVQQRHRRRLCAKLAADTEGFSGADLAAVCRAAAVRCLSSGDDGAEEGVAERHFMEARKEDVDRSSSAELVKRIANWRPNKASVL